LGDKELNNLDLSSFYKALKTGKKLEEEYKKKIDRIKNIMDEVSRWVFSDGRLNIQIKSKIGKLRDFIINNHNYLGEPPNIDRYGNSINNPIIKDLEKYKLPHWLLGEDYNVRSILSPKSF